MKVVYSDAYNVEIGYHVFPVEKYHLIKEKLLNERIINKLDILTPSFPEIEDLMIVHEAEYVDDLKYARPTRRLLLSEMPVTKDLIYAQILSAAGTHLTALTALKEKVCFHDGGGFHHAFPDHAEGFCYVNDIAYSARKLINEGLVKKVAIIDCDLHQGNGTAFIFRNDSRVFTFSIHQENLYPVKQQSDLDIGLEDETKDEEYLERLKTGLDQIFSEFRPEFVYYLAGADPYMYDQLGSLQLTIEGLIKRDRAVLKECRDKNIPVAIALGGGYAINLIDTVTIHVNTAKVARDISLDSNDNKSISGC